MNEEVNAVLQVYQNRVSTLLAQNIALEAKLVVANNAVAKLKEEVKGLDKPTSVSQDPDPVVDGGEV
tara:strand:- start:323 stop:523 length:201 start_codon:yes stop_codon:yes gene_type:complete